MCVYLSFKSKLELITLPISFHNFHLIRFLFFFLLSYHITNSYTLDKKDNLQPMLHILTDTSVSLEHLMDSVG